MIALLHIKLPVLVVTPHRVHPIFVGLVTAHTVRESTRERARESERAKKEIEGKLVKQWQSSCKRATVTEQP